MDHRSLRFRLGLVAVACALLLAAPGKTPAEESPLAQARRHLLRGRYAEAAQAYAALATEYPAQAALGLARTDVSRGRLDQAIQHLQAAIAQATKNGGHHLADQPAGRAAGAGQGAFEPDPLADLYAELALLHLERGDTVAAGNEASPAEIAVTAALKLEPSHPTARWVQAELLRLRGQVKEAAAAYEWFVDFYNRNQQRIVRPEDLRAIALAAAQAARWQRRPGDFRFVVNKLLPRALELDGDYWPAHYEAGRLFLEKYNEADAARSLSAALAINPLAAEVHAALARLALQRYDLDAAKRSIERALEIRPLTEAYALQADWHLANFDHAAARTSLLRALEYNLRDPSILGQVAALGLLESRGQPTAPVNGASALNTPRTALDAPPAAIIAAVEAANPAAGEFYFALATRLDDARRFDLAERYYRLAVEKLPQLPGPQASLGLMLMRLGREEEAQAALEAAYEADPFHVRVVNMLQVLEVLADYQRLETEHFIIRFDQRDAVLARCAARYLEDEVYPSLCRQFGFEPQGKTLIEIFNQARSTGGHGWFSARMVGLPYIGTVGACAGNMVGMVSPAAMPQPFNWARVLKHEFVHVLNLQQTAYNVPHWFTEALAVLNEDFPRPEAWNRLLARRHAAGTLFTLDDINLGFIRPDSSDDWTLAYCQAELYAQYMLERFGEDALARLLAAFALVRTTPEAIHKAFNVDVNDFEAGYRRYVDGVVAGIRVSPESTAIKYADLLKAVEVQPRDPKLLARLAAEELARKQFASARQHAQAALAAAGENDTARKVPQASWVLAQLKLQAGETAEAIKLLEAAHDPAAPDAQCLALLARLKLRQGDRAAAEELYLLAQKTWPDEARWPEALAALYLAAEDEARLVEPLTRLAALDADNVTVRKKLAQLALKRRAFAEAANWARQALHIDVADAATHRLAGAALALAGQTGEATEAYALAVELQPQMTAWRIEWAKVLIAAGDRDQARAVLSELLVQEPGHEAATTLLQSLTPSP